VDLGEVEPIDQKVNEFRRDLGDSDDQTVDWN
jgi:hypothetical protein